MCIRFFNLTTHPPIGRVIKQRSRLDLTARSWANVAAILYDMAPHSLF